MDLMQEIIARAKANKQRIVLPEGTEERTLKAADRLVADEVADIILIGNPAEINSLAAQYGLNHIGQTTIIDPKNHEKKAAYADLLFQLRQKKGMTPEKAAVLVEDPLFLACLMIKSGDADGEIAGTERQRYDGFEEREADIRQTGSYTAALSENPGQMDLRETSDGD